MRHNVAMICCLLLPGCAFLEKPREVRVPVYTHAAPPTELLAPLEIANAQVFISPTDPQATSALTLDGERAIKHLLLQLLTRIRAWETWANTK